jgi:CheY-like chemotaxis protein
MDMSLPVLDGWTATARLKSEPETQAIPIVALTAHALVDERQRALDAGCDGFHTKPIDFPSLLATMARLCPGLPNP